MGCGVHSRVGNVTAVQEGNLPIVGGTGRLHIRALFVFLAEATTQRPQPLGPYRSCLESRLVCLGATKLLQHLRRKRKSNLSALQAKQLHMVVFAAKLPAGVESGIVRSTVAGTVLCSRSLITCELRTAGLPAPTCTHQAGTQVEYQYHGRSLEDVLTACGCPRAQFVRFATRFGHVDGAHVLSCWQPSRLATAVWAAAGEHSHGHVGRAPCGRCLFVTCPYHPWCGCQFDGFSALELACVHGRMLILQAASQTSSLETMRNRSSGETLATLAARVRRGSVSVR